jgi:flagellar motor switch protein FliM
MTMTSLGAKDMNGKDTLGGFFSPASLLSGAAPVADTPLLFRESLERIADACTPQIEKITGAGLSPACSLAGSANDTASEFLASLDRASVTGIFEVPSANARLVANLDHDFLDLVIELMCGGMCAEPAPTTPRPGTSIDRQFARVAFNLIASVMEKDWLGFGLGAVTFGQIETKLDPLVLGKRAGKVVVATLALSCRERRATCRIAIPEAIVNRFQQDTLPPGVARDAGDPKWTAHFQSEIGRTVVKLDACIDANSLRLSDVAALKVGQILTLPRSASTRCELRGDKKLLFRCELGQSEGRYSVRISEVAPETPIEAAPRAELSSIFDVS